MQLVPVVFGVAAGGLMIFALTGAAQARVKKYVLKPRPLTPQIKTIAAKWAKLRGLPVEWVIATILSESGGDPNAVGDYHVDPRGASVGLMQVNTVAHKAAMAKAGVTRAMLFQPDKNIEWGTMILRDVYVRVANALKQRRSSVPIDQLVRLQYTGIPVIKAILEGRDPRQNDAAATKKVVAWQRNLAEAQALV